MTYVRPHYWPFALAAYLLGGLIIGAAVPAMKGFAAAHWGRAGLAVAFVINVAMPLLVIALAAVYPRWSVALPGTFLATLAFLAAVGLRPPPTSGWLRSLLGQMGPILVVACVAYHVLGAATVGVLQTVRRVGHPPDPAACPQCGYLLIGLAGNRCPECGRPCTATDGFASSNDG